jgi:SPX domain protein involved in polyphosphate accumulation
MDSLVQQKFSINRRTHKAGAKGKEQRKIRVVIRTRDGHPVNNYINENNKISEYVIDSHTRKVM